MARISVILPTYNRPKMLERALRSVEAQTFEDFEVLVINDAGEDVRDVVAQFPFARYLVHETNRGLPATRNTGLRAAKGEYIAYLDDDDVYYSKHLQTLVGLLRLINCRLIYTDCHFWINEREFRLAMSFDYDRDRLLQHNLTPVICVMHEKSLIDEAGYFDESLKNHEDYDLWLRMSEITVFHHHPQVTCAYSIRRNDPEQMSANAQVMLDGLRFVQERFARKHSEMTQA